MAFNSSSREGAARSSFINLPQVLPTILDHPSHTHVRVALAGKARRCYIISQSLVVSCILSYSLRSAVHACNARSPCDRSSSSTREAQPSRCTTTTVKIPTANRCKSSTSEASIRGRTFFQSRPSSCACDEPLHKRPVQVELTNPERYGGFLFSCFFSISSSQRFLIPEVLPYNPVASSSWSSLCPACSVLRYRIYQDPPLGTTMANIELHDPTPNIATKRRRGWKFMVPLH
jgi:hypothetical protein